MFTFPRVPLPLCLRMAHFMVSQSPAKTEDFWMESFRRKWGLNCRNIAKDPFCPRCRSFEESSLHALVYFKAAKSCWKASIFSNSFEEWRAPDFGVLLMDQLIFIISFQLDEFIAVSWAIWYARNQFVHTRKFISAQKSLDRAYRILVAQKRLSPALLLKTTAAKYGLA